MTLHKLKVAARQHEQREEWREAIDLYRQAIQEGEGTSEGGDPALFNRIGDLAHKAGDFSAACDAWDQAASRYGDLGFFNNAIALCGKILRLDPSRLQTYLELARYQARKRVLYEVRLDLHTYLDQMKQAGHADTARTAVLRFASEFPGWHDLDILLDELLGREPATGTPRSGGDSRGPAASGLVFIDTGPMEIERASEPPAIEMTLEPTVTADLEFEPRPETAPLAGFQPTVPTERDAAVPPPVGETIEGLVDIERTSHEVGDAAPIEGLETAIAAPVEVIASTVEGLERNGVERPDVGAELTFIETSTDIEPPQLREVPHAEPDDPLGQRVLAGALLEHGDRSGGIAALERALALYQSREEWLLAYQVASDLIQAEPAAIGRHQARVEISARMRDPGRLCEAYAALGDALVRDGSTEKAIAVYRRVLEIDDEHPRARAALKAMAPEAAPSAAADAGFIDFGAMVNDDTGLRSTRMRTEMPEVAPDEQDTFRDALAEFKRALDQHLPIEDHQSHYDLGIAFKEMGLLDEAIGEFQKALRAPEVRLRTSEALGQVFFDQGRPAVAEAVLRGVERGPEGDAEKIGVLYWLGRALEAQGKGTDAVEYFQRVIAVDVGFQDASERASHAGGKASG